MVKRQWWTVEQVAEELGVNPETVRRWIRGAVLPAESLGSARLGYRVARADLDAFVQKRFGRLLSDEQGQQEAA